MKKKKTSIKMIYTMAVLSGLLGVIALYYPKVADAWNRYVQGRNVGKYVESVNDIDYEKELRAAQEYNEALYQHGTNNITEYTNKLSGKEEGSDTLKESAEIVNPDKEYESLLSILDDGMMGYVEIPAIHVNVPIYHYTSEEVLAKGVGHLYGTSLPVGGENTHSVITDKTKVTEITDDVQEYSFPVQVKKIDEANQDKGLEGAEFTLTRKDGAGKTGTNEYTIATDDTGVATFNRLDEGTYTVKETKAPSGYAINPDEFEIKITPTYGENGKIASYAVDMKNVSQNKAVGSIVIDAADDSIIAGNITDSRLQTLPSTGGAGTKMLILLAAGLAGVTVSLVVIGKKKEQK